MKLYRQILEERGIIKRKIYKRSTILWERKLKELHNIKEFCVSVTSQENELCVRELIKEMQFNAKKALENAPSASQMQLVPYHSPLENKPFKMEISSMALKEDEFMKKYNLNRDIVMKICLFNQVDIGYVFSCVKHYFDLKESKIAEKIEKFLECYETEKKPNETVKVEYKDDALIFYTIVD